MVLALLAGALPVVRAVGTNLVVVGDDLQTRINEAGPGDTLVIQSGTYSGKITVDKPLTFVRSGTEPVNLLYPVTVATAGIVNLSQLNFAADIGAATQNLDLRIYDCSGQNLTVTDGKLTLRRSYLAGTLNLTRTDTDALRHTNNGRVNFNGASSATKSKMTLSQCRVQSLVLAYNCQLAMAYTFAQGVGTTDSDTVGVGNQLFNSTDRLGTPEGWLTAAVFVRGKHRWSNSQFFNSSYWGFRNEQFFAVNGTDCDQEIINCDIITWGSGWPGVHGGSSLGIGCTGGRHVLKNNYFEIHSHSPPSYGVHGLNGAIVDFSDSLVHGASWSWDFLQGTAYGAIDTIAAAGASAPVPTNVRVVTDNLASVTWPDQWGYKVMILPNSPLINGGSKDPLYNNTDGSRNTVGSTGGPLYHPENATTDRPIAFWATTTPRRIIKGVDTVIKVEAAAAAGH